MLQIRIIQKILFPFPLRKQFRKAQRQPDQFLYRPAAHRRIRQDLLLRSGKILLLQTFQQLLCLLPFCLHRFLQRLVGIRILLSGQHRKRQRAKRLLQRLIGPTVQQRLCLFQIRLKHRFIEYRRARPGQDRQRLSLHIPDTLQILPGLAHQVLHPRSSLQFFLRGYLTGFHTPGKPFLRPRIAGRKIKQIQDQILDPLIRLARRIALDKVCKLRRLFGIPFFQNLLHHI